MLLCKNPIHVVSDGKFYEVGCGKCRQCLQTRRSSWTQRLQMQFDYSTCSKFVTITYDDLHLPPMYSETDENGDERFWYTLDKRHCQLFLKRFRRSFTASFGKFSYFLVGEFGDRTARPHYHLLMFFNQHVNDDELKIAILKTWQNGYIIDVQDLRGVGGCKYLADYLGKQLGDDGLNSDRFDEELYHCDDIYSFKEKWSKIRKRPKTFMLSSRRPAIGKCYCDNPLNVKYHKQNVTANCNYVPRGVENSIATPLCRYIRNKIYNENEKELIRNSLQVKTDLQRKNFEKRFPNKDWNVYIKQQRKFNDFKLKIQTK